MSSIISAVEGLFRGSLASNLRALLKAGQDRHFQCGRHVDCHFSASRSAYRFYASIVTGDARLGDADGNYQLYSSKVYPTLREGMAAMTAEVSAAASKFPHMHFFRIFTFGKAADAQYYLAEHSKIANRETWLEEALMHDWRAPHNFVREQFEAGSWTPNVTKGHEVFDSLAHTIREITPIKDPPP